MSITTQPSGLLPGGFLRSAGRAYWTEAPARPAISNVALADILRCPVVVADQAAGVEADLWVRMSAV